MMAYSQKMYDLQGRKENSYYEKIFALNERKNFSSPSVRLMVAEERERL